MITHLLYGTQILKIEVPDSSTVYGSSYPSPGNSPGDIVLDAVRRPLDSLPIREALKKRRTGDVVIVVSDITRPVPYSQFLNVMLEEIKSAGVKREDILILIATGMHRQSTQSEREQMFGSEVNKNYRIVDHSAVCDDDLVELDGKSRAGNPVRLNRHYVEAGFRIVTGLVEPHFMAGFSGGRKAICPGLVSLESVHKFHGYSFLASPAARNGNLEGNPCHEEALSMARLAGVDFCLNIVLNKDRRIVRAFAGDLEVSHRVACECVLKYACPRVLEEHDIVLTSSGGYPLDATFYQCVKGMVSCLPAVKKNGRIVLVGGCLEGVGSLEYKEILYRYSGRWKEFLKDIEMSEVVMRDQWEFQVQTRALDKIGQQNLFFITHGLPADELEKLSINGIPSEPEKVGDTVQEVVDKLLVPDMKLAVIEEGPYCAPLE